MPTNFECNGCDLRFSIGRYHYHRAPRGFGASTLAVCAHCGAPHRIEHARDISRWAPTAREPTPPPPQQQDRLLAEAFPPTNSKASSRELEIVGPRTAPTGRFQLDQQACGHCSAIGTLITNEGQAPSACPQCGSSIELVESWMT